MGNPLPEVLTSSLSTLNGPVRFTWYLSPELARADHLKAADGLMANLIAAAGQSGPEISAVVRGPEPGERQPGSLLPIPATDEEGNMFRLYSSLVLDWRDKRIVIPDIWETDWLPLDLARALQDLGAGGPVSAAYFNGSTDGSGMPVSLLAGRWLIDEWYPETSSPDRFEVLIIRDGPVFDGIALDLEIILDTYVERGGAVLMAGSGGAHHLSSVGEWAKGWIHEGSPGTVLFIDDSDFLDSAAYETGRLSFRDLDTALLLASGRIDILSLIPEQTNGIQSGGRREVGSRLGKAAGRIQGEQVPDVEKVSEIVFQAGDEEIAGESGILPVFSLERNGNDWFMVSDDWRLPARSDRIMGFLRRLKAGSGEVWFVTDNPNLLGDDIGGGAGIIIRPERGRPYTLEFAGERRAGGGTYFFTEDGIALWPLINAGDISGDPRYWLERRLFPQQIEVIRAELRTDIRLYWRLHEESGEWVLTGRGGKRVVIEDEAAAGYLGRLLRAESLILVPDTPASGSGESPLILMLEDESGRRIEYRLSDLNDGRVAATSGDGILHILDDTVVGSILSGPVG